MKIVNRQTKNPDVAVVTISDIIRISFLRGKWRSCSSRRSTDTSSSSLSSTASSTSGCRSKSRMDACKKYKVFYPTIYAYESENKDAKLFNCVQRGHQNSLEMMPTLFMLMVVGGIRHPFGCATFGALYIVSKFFHFKDYATGDPQNRLEFV